MIVKSNLCGHPFCKCVDHSCCYKHIEDILDSLYLTEHAIKDKVKLLKSESLDIHQDDNEIVVRNCRLDSQYEKLTMLHGMIELVKGKLET